MQHLQLIKCPRCCVGKQTRVNTCNNNEKSTKDHGLCNSKLASMISRVFIDEPQEYKLKGRKYPDHNTFIIDINTKTKLSSRYISLENLIGRKSKMTMQKKAMPAKFCIQNVYKSFSKWYTFCMQTFCIHFVYILYTKLRKVCRYVEYMLHANISYIFCIHQFWSIKSLHHKHYVYNVYARFIQNLSY